MNLKLIAQTTLRNLYYGKDQYPVSPTLKVAQPATSPNVLEPVVPNKVKDYIVLLLSFNGHGVHAILATGVPRFQPVNLGIAIFGNVSGVKVPVTIVEKFLRATGAFDCCIMTSGQSNLHFHIMMPILWDPYLDRAMPKIWVPPYYWY